jgi:hypothetical protein
MRKLRSGAAVDGGVRDDGGDSAEFKATTEIGGGGFYGRNCIRLPSAWLLACARAPRSSRVGPASLRQNVGQGASRAAFRNLFEGRGGLLASGLSPRGGHHGASVREAAANESSGAMIFSCGVPTLAATRGAILRRPATTGCRGTSRSRILTEERPRNTCRGPFARSSPFGCLVQQVPFTYFSLDTIRAYPKRVLTVWRAC